VTTVTQEEEYESDSDDNLVELLTEVVDARWWKAADTTKTLVRDKFYPWLKKWGKRGKNMLTGKWAAVATDILEDKTGAHASDAGEWWEAYKKGDKARMKSEALEMFVDVIVKQTGIDGEDIINLRAVLETKDNAKIKAHLSKMGLDAAGKLLSGYTAGSADAGDYKRLGTSFKNRYNQAKKLCM